MTRSTRVVVGTLAALAVALPATASTSGAPTDARATRSWTTIQKFVGAKEQACKVASDGGTTWRIYNRLDARDATARTQARAWVTHNGVDTWRKWSSGWVRRGTISGVGSFEIPREPGYAIQHGIGTSQMGDGGQIAAWRIPHC